MVCFCSLCSPRTTTMRKIVSSDEPSMLGARELADWPQLPERGKYSWRLQLVVHIRSIHLAWVKSCRVHTEQDCWRNQISLIWLLSSCSKQQVWQHSSRQEPLDISFGNEDWVSACWGAGRVEWRAYMCGLLRWLQPSHTQEATACL